MQGQRGQRPSGRIGPLCRCAIAEDEVVQTRDDKGRVRLTPDQIIAPRDRRREVIDAARASATDKVTIGASAACSQDFLYSDVGLPE